MLDVNTFLGRKSVKDAERAYYLFSKFNPHYKIITTLDTTASKVDGFILKNDCVFRVFETKCRYSLTINKLRYEFNNEWLVTSEKIKDSITIAKLLCVPLIGFLYLVDEDILLIQKICDECGNFTTNIREEETYTKATINGGLALRKNMFINVSNAIILDERMDVNNTI